MAVNSTFYAVGQTVWVLVSDYKILGKQISMSRRESHKLPWVVVETEIRSLKVGKDSEVQSLFVGMWVDHHQGMGGETEVFLPNVYTDPATALSARDYMIKKLLERGQEIFKYQRVTYTTEKLWVT